MFTQTQRAVGAGIIRWGRIGGLLAVVGTLALMAGHGDTLEAFSPMVALVTYALVLSAAAAVYVLWRLASIDPADAWNRRLSGWLVIGLTVGAMHGSMAAYLEQSTPGDASLGNDSWLPVSQVAAALLLVLMAALCERLELPADPALVGIVGGLVLCVASSLVMVAAPGPDLDGMLAVGMNTTLMLSGLALALTLLRRTRVSPWIRKRLAFATVALVTAQCASHVDGPVFAAAAIIGHALGALVLCALAHHLLRHMLERHQDQVSQLHSAYLEAEQAALGNRELLHEVGSTVAGIATASSVIKLRPELAGPPRERLERMMEAEVARLVRLMSDRAVIEPDRDVVVDDVLAPLVAMHQARGLDLEWAPSGLVATGDSDDLAEVVNILLENAGRHGQGRVTLTVVADAGGDAIEIRCADQGAGVPLELRHQLFESGARRQDSPGQGLGLSIAHRLMSQRGGSLRVVDDVPGTTFAARLPLNGTADAALDHAS